MTHDSDRYLYLLDSLWTKNGRIYRPLGVITAPAIIIEDVATGERETHVLSSLNFAEYQELRPVSCTDGDE